ncbi:hypothetical protein ACIG56_23325 [Nocardia fusca]|uniref:hypothetical protein n=1 Tax=Nocardia fusca TaxID=941183 RepID=UPI0037C9626D
MIEMQAVVEVPLFDTESPQPWPVASVAAGSWLVLDMITGMAAVPGCCAGLEDWRDWGQVLTGGSPWLADGDRAGALGAQGGARVA